MLSLLLNVVIPVVVQWQTTATTLFVWQSPVLFVASLFLAGVKGMWFKIPGVQAIQLAGILVIICSTMIDEQVPAMQMEVTQQTKQCTGNKRDEKPN